MQQLSHLSQLAQLYWHLHRLLLTGTLCVQYAETVSKRTRKSSDEQQTQADQDELLAELETELRLAEEEPVTRSGRTTQTPSPQALIPWGELPLPPVGEWGDDVLGAGYQAMTLPLGDDSEGEVVATLVRTDPGSGFRARRRKRKKRFTLLYLHGRNDYFFNTEAAELLEQMGAAFYALDLRKYGRSLRPWQTIGYADDMGVYDQEINLALAQIAADHPGLPVVMFGHSTGGLVAALWAWRNPGILAGLILNSAWLELQSLTSMRPALHQVISGLAKIRPRATVVGESKDNAYYRSLRFGWAGSGLDIPEPLKSTPEDPAVAGWKFADEWKLPFSYPAPAAWMDAVLRGHAQIEKEVRLDIPLLSMTSTKSASEEPWGPQLFDSDVVLNADLIVERSAMMAKNVTIERFPGKHDLLLSDPNVRTEIYSVISRWLTFTKIL